MRSNIYCPRGTSDGPSEDAMLKDGEQKESQSIDRLDLRDKGQLVLKCAEACRELAGESGMRPPTTDKST